MIENKENERRLESWKEIATYLQREPKTVQRWEKHEGLPVHRHRHRAGSTVYAYPSELDTWRTHREPVRESTRSAWLRPVAAFASTTALAVVLLTTSSGPQVGAVAQAADGIVTRQVWTGPAASTYHSLSPDGRYMAFTDTAGELAVHDLTTGENRRLTNKNVGRQNSQESASSSVFSPDGKQVAFLWENQRWDWELHVVGMDGSEPRTLYQRERHDIMPCDWSPDGRLILASLSHRRTEGSKALDDQIVTVGAADGSETVLKTFDGAGPGTMRFSPDGRFVVYAFPADQKENLDIFVLSVADGQVTPLVQHPAREVLLGWATDGRSVLFLSDRTGDYAAWLIDVVDGRPQGEARLVKRNMGEIVPLRFTRDGSFYYTIQDVGYNVYTATLDGGAPTLLVKRFLGGNSEPIWSPDGKSIAYKRTPTVRAPSDTLCIRSMETGEEREYTPGFRFMSPQWSPDGSSILLRVTGVDPPVPKGSYRVDLETGEITQVYLHRFGAAVITPHWSADGKALYYIEPGKPERLMRRDLATGRDEEIRPLPEGVGSGEVFPSPDNRWLAFGLLKGNSQSSLAIMPVGRTEIRELDAGRGALIKWAADSQQILFARRTSRTPEETRWELWGFPVDGVEPRRLGGFSVPHDVRGLSVHPDGRQLVFWVREVKNEVWAMENILPDSGGE